MVDDDVRLLLPNGHGETNDIEWITSPTSSGCSIDMLAADESYSECSSASSSPPCDLGVIERLLRTHPVWFLPDIQRAGAVHLLQGKEQGSFVVRGSSQTNTMAVSVRLPPDPGPYIEHYLIQSHNGQLSLESSTFKFDSIPELIAHYSQCCDELPVQLRLPQALRDATNRKQLSSLALLGQEFWRYSMTSPKPTSPSAPTITDSAIDVKVTSPSSETAKSKSKSSKSSGCGDERMDTANDVELHIARNHSMPRVNTMDLISPIANSFGTFCQIDTPSDTMSSISSFTSAGLHAVQSPTSNSFPRSEMNGNIDRSYTHQKSQHRKSLDLDRILSNAASPMPKCVEYQRGNCRTRPTPPNTLNLVCYEGMNNNNNNNHIPVKPFIKLNSFNSPTTFSPNFETPSSEKFAGFKPSGRSSQIGRQRATSKSNLNTPTSSVSVSGLSHREKAVKKSKHYQESDILESPQIYCQSSLADKSSDYEDLWSKDGKVYQTTLSHGPLMSSFRSTRGEISSPRPDLLPELRTVTSLSGNILSPTGSLESSTASSSQSTSHQHTDRHHDTNPKLTITAASTPRNDNSPTPIGQLVSHEALLELVDVSQIYFSDNPPMAESKEGSPFYAEPAYSLNNQPDCHPRPLNRNLFPPQLIQTPATPLVQSPLDNERPPIITCHPSDALTLNHIHHQNQHNQQRRLDPWPVDSSWEFMNMDCNENDYDTDEHWNTARSKPYPSSTAETAKMCDAKKEPVRLPAVTIQQLILTKMPELGAKLIGGGSCARDAGPPKWIRMSSYDNVDKKHSGYKHNINILQLARSAGGSSVHSDDGTVFSEPWDSSQWDTLSINQDSTSTTPASKSRVNTVCMSEGDTITEETYPDTVIENHLDDGTLTKRVPQPRVATIARSRTGRDRGVLNHPRNKPPSVSGGHHDPSAGSSIGDYAHALASDTKSTFSRNIQNFITCTKESREHAPQVVMRNMRQFMSGMKNYLVKHGEGDFQNEVLRARSRLKADEFLNLDQILETVMHRLVVLPLKEHLYSLFVEHYMQSGQIQLLVENVQFGATRTPQDFGIPSTVTPPSPAAMQHISLLLLRLQEADLPLDKLAYLLAVVSAIFEAATHSQEQALGADYFLPLLVYVVAKCEFIGAEIEAEFMYCLLQQSLLTGEAGYYLTSLCSAVQVLKELMKDVQSATGNHVELLDNHANTLPACSSVLRVIIPDECNGSLQTRTLPVRPNTTTKEVCRTIAHKARITNPQDYALFELVDGKETQLNDSEFPQESRMAARGKHCMFAYKRIEAKIAWPTLPNYH